MPDTISIILPDGYRSPTQKEISRAKRWTVLRNENAARLSSRIESRLKESAKELTRIGYSYNCNPEEFQFSQDRTLREDVAEKMEKLEEDIMELVQEYSLNDTDDEDQRSRMLPWLMALHSKNTDNLRETLHERVRQFLFDTEAQISAMLLAAYDQTKAIGRILSTMHTVYASPEMLAAFRMRSSARFIISRGVHEGNVGLSSSGAVNIENFGNMTARMAWSRSQYEKAQDEGKEGFVVLRGSNYPCELCDSKTGFHTIGQTDFIPPYHGHCQCYAVFVTKETSEE